MRWPVLVGILSVMATTVVAAPNQSADQYFRQQCANTGGNVTVSERQHVFRDGRQVDTVVCDQLDEYTFLPRNPVTGDARVTLDKSAYFLHLLLLSLPAIILTSWMYRRYEHRHVLVPVGSGTVWGLIIPLRPIIVLVPLLVAALAPIIHLWHTRNSTTRYEKAGIVALYVFVTAAILVAYGMNEAVVTTL